MKHCSFFFPSPFFGLAFQFCFSYFPGKLYCHVILRPSGIKHTSSFHSPDFLKLFCSFPILHWLFFSCDYSFSIFSNHMHLGLTTLKILSVKIIWSCGNYFTIFSSTFSFDLCQHNRYLQARNLFLLHNHTASIFKPAFLF